MSGDIQANDTVRAPMRKDGLVIRLERRYRQDGAVVQWPGRPYADWHPLRGLVLQSKPATP